MFIIAIAQQKGGCGKSITAINLSGAATKAGYITLLLEVDGQGTASQFGRARASEGMPLRKLPPLVEQVDGGRLEQKLMQLRGLYDVVVIDLPGANNMMVNPSVRAADLIILPTRANTQDLEASVPTLGVVQRLRKPYGYLFTFADGPRDKRVAEARAAIEAAGHPVIPQSLQYRHAYPDAATSGQTVLEYTPEGKAAEDALKAAEEVLGVWRWIEHKMGEQRNAQGRETQIHTLRERLAAGGDRVRS